MAQQQRMYELPQAEWVEISRIVPDPHQPRKHFAPEDLQELASTMDQHDLQTPITVREDPKKKGWHIIVGGERRYRAAQMLEWKKIPAVVLKGEVDHEIVQFLENLRVNLNPIEEARGYQGLIDRKGWSQVVVAEKIGASPVHVSTRLQLLRLPDELQEAVADGRFKPTAALELVRGCADHGQMREIMGPLIKEGRGYKGGVSIAKIKRAIYRRDHGERPKVGRKLKPGERLSHDYGENLRNAAFTLLELLHQLVGEEGEQAPTLAVFGRKWDQIPESRQRVIGQYLELVGGRISMWKDFRRRSEGV